MSLSHSPSIITDGLQYHVDAGNIKSYPGSGTSWADLSLNKNSMAIPSTIFNSSTKTFNFDYTAYTTTISSPITYSLASDWTVQMVLYPPSGIATTWNYLFGGDWSGNGGYFMFHGNQAQFCIYSDYYNSTAYLEYGGPTLGGSVPFDKYSVLTVVARLYSAANYQVQFSVYVNGVLSETFVHTESSRTTNSLNLKWIGSGYRNGQYNLSQFSNWNRALTQAEITQNFNAIRGRYGL